MRCIDKKRRLLSIILIIVILSAGCISKKEKLVTEYETTNYDTYLYEGELFASQLCVSDTNVPLNDFEADVYKRQVKGDLTLMNDGKIRFEQLANNGSEIKEGEQVVASHISSKYLQGILIGYVSEITTDANNLTRSGYITPAVDFQHLQEVLVITTTKEEMLEKEE